MFLDVKTFYAELKGLFAHMQQEMKGKTIIATGVNIQKLSYATIRFS